MTSSDAGETTKTDYLALRPGRDHVAQARLDELVPDIAWYGGLTACHSAAETARRARRAFANGRLVADLADDDLILGGYVLALLRIDDLEFCERVIERTRDDARARGSAPAAASAYYYIEVFAAWGQVAWRRDRTPRRHHGSQRLDSKEPLQ